MRTHTQNFKDGIKQYGRQFTDKIYYNNNEYDGEHIFSVKYAVDSQIFRSVMQSLTIDTDISMSVGDTLDYGIKLTTATDEMRFNNFIVNKIEDQKDKKSKLITCYDSMVKSMVDYESFYEATTDTTFTTDKNYYQLSNGKYTRYTGDRTGNPYSLGLYQSMFPLTIRNYLAKICSRLNITFASASDTFTNYDKVVTEEHYVDVDNNSLGYTFRDVLDDIAEATGSFICINENNELEVRYITDTTNRNLYAYDGAFYNSFINGTYLYYGANYSSIFFPCKSNTTYTISKLRSSLNHIGTIRSSSPSGQNVYNVVNMSSNTTYDGTTRVNGTLTTGSNDKYIVVEIGRLSGDDYNGRTKLRNSIQIEYGTQVTDYETKQLDTINEDFFNDKNVNIGKKVGPYNVVVLSRTNDSDNLYYPATLPQNPNEIKIVDNPILEQTNRDTFIQGIYNKINGLEFYLNDFATKGVLYYEVGDKYNVSINGSTNTCLMLNDHIKRTTGVIENIHTDEPKASVTEYKYASATDKLEKMSKNAYIIADKAEGKVEQIVSAVGSNGEVTSASIITAINGDTSQIKLNADKIYINGVTFDQNQTMTMTEGTINIENSNGNNSIYTYEDDSLSNTRTETSMFPAGVFTDIKDLSNDTLTDYAEYYCIGTTISNGSNTFNATASNLSFYDSNNNATIDADAETGALKFRGYTIGSGEDLNDIDRSHTGFYAVHTPNQSVANVPDYSNEVGFLNVYCWSYGNGDWCVQEYYVVTGDRVNKYIRSHHWGTSSNDWSNWKPICVDTGWVDLSSNVNSGEGFAVRPDFPVMARRINDVVYWRGMIYSTTAKNYKMANILLNIPSQFLANYEMGRGGIMYDINTKYYMYQESNYIRVSQEVDFRADPSWYGYNLSTISGYPQA